MPFPPPKDGASTTPDRSSLATHTLLAPHQFMCKRFIPIVLESDRKIQDTPKSNHYVTAYDYDVHKCTC